MSISPHKSFYPDTRFMQCLQARRKLLATPRERSADERAHLESCPECAAFARQVGDLDDDLERALRVRPPEALAHRILLARGHNPLGQYAAAAAVAVFAASLGLVAGNFVDMPGAPAEIEAVGPTHPAVVAIAEVVDEQPGLQPGEPDTLHVDQGLRELGLELKKEEASAHYVGKCHIEGSQRCEHIVVSTPDAHANVMLVPDSPLPQRVLVADRRMVALVNPTGGGGYIVVADSPKTIKRMEKLFVKS